MKNALVDALASRGVDGGGRCRRARRHLRRAPRRHAGAPADGRRDRHRPRRPPSTGRARRRRARADARDAWRRSSSCSRDGTRGARCWWIRWRAAAPFPSRPPDWRWAPRSVGRTSLPFRFLPAFAGLPNEAPDLFPGTVAHILSLDVDEERIPTMVGNLRAAGLTGPAYDDDDRDRAEGRARADAGVRRRAAAARGATEDGRLLFQPALRRSDRRRAGRRRTCWTCTPGWAAPSRASAAGGPPASSPIPVSRRRSATCRS